MAGNVNSEWMNTLTKTKSPAAQWASRDLLFLYKLEPITGSVMG